MRKIKTPQQFEKFTEMWNTKIPRTEIAREFGICYTHVFFIARKLGLSPNIMKKGRSPVIKEKIITTIKEKGVCSHADILKVYSEWAASRYIRELVRNEQISMFRLKVGIGQGGIKFTSEEMFNGIRTTPHYYIDKNQASKFIIETLQLSPDIPENERHALTQHLRRCLKPDLFKLVYKAYARNK
jgi:hypothetical protein